MSDRQPAFLAELKRRKVPRVVLVYLATAFAVIEAADVVVPRLALPDWTVTLVVVLAGLGLPVVAVLAWAFDVTPEGVSRTSAPATGHSSGQSWFSTRAVVGAGALVVLALAGGWWAGRSGIEAATDPVSGAPVLSVAVLPFANMSADANDYFSDGLTEEILNLLAKVDGLKVPARTSSFAFRDRNLDVRAIADSLGVGSVLEGSVRRDSDQIRVTAQLIQASDGFHLWSETYDRQLDNIFEIQDDIAGKIVQALRTELGVSPVVELSHERPTDDLEAYQLFLQARYLFYQRTETSLLRSVELYEEALARDPDFAEAWVGLAMTCVVLPGYAIPEFDAMERAASAAQRGLELDSTLALGYAVIGQVESGRFELLAAEAAFDTALALDSSDPTVLLWSADFDLSVGRLAEAQEKQDRAFDLDPASGVVTGWMGHHRFLEGDLDGALAAYVRSGELSWGASAFWQCVAHVAMARPIESDSTCQTLADRDEPLLAYSRGELSRDQLVDLLPDLGILFGPLWERPDLFFAGLDWRASVPEVSNSLSTVSMWAPAATAFRRDTRFVDWVERMGLPAFWDAEGWPELCSRTASGAIECH